MPDLTVASTTDTQTQVNQAAGATQEAEAEEVIPADGTQVEAEAEKPAVETKPEKKEEKTSPAIQKRFDKLTRDREEAKREAASLRERLEALEAQRAAPAAETAAATETQATEVPDKFPSYAVWSQAELDAKRPCEMEDFLDARDAWKDARRTQQEEQAAIEEQQHEVVGTYFERVAEFTKTHDDWEDVVGGSKATLPEGVGAAIVELDNGPEVAYYLGKHPEVAKELNAMAGFRAIAEVGRIAALLEKEEIASPSNSSQRANPDRRPVSSAPAPIRQLSGHSTKSSVDLGAENMDYQEFRRIRDQQEKNRYKR